MEEDEPQDQNKNEKKKTKVISVIWFRPGTKDPTIF
jgi:hypothetical protein